MESQVRYRAGSATLVLAILLLSCFAVSAAAPSSVTDGADGSTSEARYWISVDPLPIMKAHERFTITGKGNIPDGEYINFRFQFSSSDPDAAASGHSSSDLGLLTFMRLVNGTGTWSQDFDLEFTPDKCSIDIKAVQFGVSTSVLWPSDFPAGSADGTKSRIRLSSPGSKDMERPFFISGSTNLPANYPLIVEIYPREFNKQNYWQYVDYTPILREKILVRDGSYIGNFFLLQVNLTEAAAESGITISPGAMYVEVHAVNVDSRVSDHVILQATTLGPWVKIDPIREPVQGENLTVTGTTNLPAGSKISLRMDVMRHPCFWCSNPDSNPGSYCCRKCTTGNFYDNVPAEDTGGADRSWKIELPTDGWCTSETYYVHAGADVEGKSVYEDNQNFHILAK